MPGRSQTAVEIANQIDAPDHDNQTLDIRDLETNKEDKSQKNQAGGYAGLDENGKIIDSQIQGDTLRVGQVIMSAQTAPPAKFLKCDGAKYLKTAKPELAAAILPSRYYDVQLRVTLGLNASQQSTSSIIANGYYFAPGNGATGDFLMHLETGQYWIIPALSGYNSASYYPISVVFNPNNDLFYVFFYVNSSCMVYTVNPTTRATAMITNNLQMNVGGTASGVQPLDVFYLDGYFYVFGNNNQVARVTSITGGILSPVASASNIRTIAREKDDDGYMWGLKYVSNGITSLMRSIDNGATWSEVKANVSPVINNALVQSEVEIRGDGRGRSHITIFKNRIIFKIWQYSTGTQGWVMEYNRTDGSHSVLKNIGKTATQSGKFLHLWGEYLYTGLNYDEDSNFIIDADGNIITRADLVELVGGTLPIASTPTTEWYDRGFIWTNSLYDVYRQTSAHDPATEFRVPKLKSERGFHKYIKELP